jgi:CubicO group peptidase (beta-lactamase class C family)
VTSFPDYTAAIEQLIAAIRQQMAAYNITGVSVALVDDQRLVHAAGFGTAKSDSIFRAGSISKVFNAVAIMQLVEQGKLDLDAPITRYGRQFSLVVPFDGAPAVTLRQLLCHRSGLCRESPVGGYFDGSEPSLADTAAAIRDCPLLSRPNSETRYSNIGPSLAGQILAAVTGVPYHEYQQKHILGPLGMTSSGFLLEEIERGRLAPAAMRVADGRGGFVRGEAPLFDLGTIPAGNLYTTAEDLARFVSMLAAGGRAPGGQVISGRSLAEMSKLQLVETEAESIFGLAFKVSKLREHKAISHMGAVYGYTSSFMLLPGEKLGVVILCNEDIAAGPIDKLTQLALGLMVEAKLGEKAPPPPEPHEIAPQDLLPFVGEYESPAQWAELEVSDGRLVANISSQPTTLTPVASAFTAAYQPEAQARAGQGAGLADASGSYGSAAPPSKFLADSRVMNSVTVEFERDIAGNVVAFTLPTQKFTRIDPAATADVPPLWSQYVGVYGPSFIPLVVSIRHGHLYATIENELDYRLTPASRHVFICPLGMYRLEHLVFLTDAEGKVHGVNFANMYLPRHKADSQAR